METLEQEARGRIDDNLVLAGWVVQDRDTVNLAASLGVAVREFPLGWATASRTTSCL